MTNVSTISIFFLTKIFLSDPHWTMTDIVRKELRSENQRRNVLWCLLQLFQIFNRSTSGSKVAKSLPYT